MDTAKIIAEGLKWEKEKCPKGPIVGTIVVNARQMDEDDVSDTIDERRLVYLKSDYKEQPYYLSKSLNKVFIFDKERIEYFPEVRKCEDEAGRIIGASTAKEENQLAMCIDHSLRKPINEKKIGSIHVAKLKGGTCCSEPPPLDSHTISFGEVDVYFSPECGTYPYYYANSGNKIYVMDLTRITLRSPILKRKKRPLIV